MLVFDCPNLEQLDKAAQEIAQRNFEEKVWLLSGDMGIGKTTFVSHLMKHLQCDDVISSPTFSLVNEYELNSGDKVYHFDFYRINDEFEALDMGVEEYFYSGNLCLVEWPQKILNLLPDHYLLISLTLVGESRRITIKSSTL